MKKAGIADNPVSNKFSLKSAKNVKEIYELAAYLYVFGMYDLCYSVCSIVDGISFDGDYGIWDFVAKCRTMKCSIDRAAKKGEKAQKILDTVLPYEAPELYENAWADKVKIASELKLWYQEAKEGKRTASNVRYSALGICLSCNHYIQLGALPQYHTLMKEWETQLTEFLYAEEK